MRNSLWATILVVGVFTGFLAGYSVPPMVEAGMIGGGGRGVSSQTGVDQETDDYYRQLSSEADESGDESQ